MNPFIIYHKNCFDGICSAWVLSKLYPKATFHPMAYGEELPALHPSDNVIFVDFSLKRQEMLNLASVVNSITVLEHHKTAQEELKDFEEIENVLIIFDMNKSGAQLAWDFVNLKNNITFPYPRLVDYVADRDLWKFELHNSEDINAYIQSFPMDIPSYEYLDLRMQHHFHECVIEGRAITRYKNESVARMCKMAKYQTFIINNETYSIPIVNASLLFSEVGHALCLLYKDSPFSISYFKRADNKVQYSLRSIGDFDVSKIAKDFGGGGHKNAAGFELDYFIS